MVQKDIAVIPKSTQQKRISENISLFDWQLDEDDVAELDSLDQGPSARICDFEFFPGIKNHPEFPF